MKACDVLSRVIDERDALQSKLERLDEFLLSAACLDLTKADRILLSRQSDAMHDYLDILDVRVALMKEHG